MELETTETVRSTQSRHEKSLGLLTMKFVSLLQEAKDGVLDLKVAADSLAVKQKRRIYDITNVLEGVGLIEKKNKNMIQWRGENTGSQTQEVMEQLKFLKAQISDLETQEKTLDDQKVWLEDNIKHLNHDPITSTYKFVTHEDICSAFSGETLLAVVAPAGTQLEVPLPEMGQTGQKKYQVNLRSHSAPIQVMLINRDSDAKVPIVFPVPPSDDIYPMPSPPNTPASLQRFPLSTSAFSSSNTSSSYCSQDSVCSDHQMVLPEHNELTPSSTPPDVQMECYSQSAAELEQQHIDFQSELDVTSLLKLSTVGDHMKDDRQGAVDLIDELMSDGEFYFVLEALSMIPKDNHKTIGTSGTERSNDQVISAVLKHLPVSPHEDATTSTDEGHVEPCEETPEDVPAAVQHLRASTPSSAPPAPDLVTEEGSKVSRSL